MCNTFELITSTTDDDDDAVDDDGDYNDDDEIKMMTMMVITVMKMIMFGLKMKHTERSILQGMHLSSSP